MNPQIERLQRDLFDVRARFARTTTGLSDKSLLWSTSSNEWSIAQIIEHVNLVAEAIAPQLGDALSELSIRRGSPRPFRYTLFERVFIRMVSPNPPFRSPVPSRYVPPVEVEDPQQTITRFLVLQGQIDGWVNGTRGFDLAAIRIPSPASRFVKLSVGAWIHATIAHEQYHLLQIEALRAHPSFPRE
jgi:hypothetical protein